MKLDKLIITVDGEPCRTVQFVDGLNLITNDKSIGRTGNSVGKSTLSRIMDFMFLGSIKPIYMGEEYQKSNTEIEELFRNNDVQCTLSFTDNFGVYHVLNRNLVIDAVELFYVDGTKVEKDEYERTILSTFFGVTTSRPSLRLLAPKFIRNDSHRMLNTTHFLDRNRSDNDYSELFLFLFGFNDSSLLTQKRKANNLVKRNKKIRTSLNVILKDQKTKSSLKLKKKEVDNLEANILKLDFSSDCENPIGSLHEIQSNEDRLNTAIFSATLKLDNIFETIRQLDQHGSNYLIGELKAIYEFAGVSIDQVSRSFEDTLAFHDNLVAKKKIFIESELPQVNIELSELRTTLSQEQTKKHNIFNAMRSRESIDQITRNIKTLGEMKSELGKLEGIIEQQETAQHNLTIAEGHLTSILELILEQISVINSFEEIFITHFESITNILHNEKYKFTLNFDEQLGVCHPLVENSSANPEGGKKKAEVIAFDFAYIATCLDLGLNRPYFIFHDSIEDIDQKQVESIFALSDQLQGQHIVSVLSDKFSEDTYSKYINGAILLLSEDERFFNL